MSFLIVNRKIIILSSLIFFLSGSIWFYFSNPYAGECIGFKCGHNNENNIFLLKSNGTFIFKSDNLPNNIVGKWAVSKEEKIKFTVKKRNLTDIGSIVRFNLHTSKENITTNIPYASGCAVYVGQNKKIRLLLD